VQALYPFHYPRPGYPLHIDDTYQKTLANLRQWAMIATNDPGLVCTVGLTASPTTCVSGVNITGNVPLINASPRGIPLSIPAGKKVLNLSNGVTDYYDKLESYLNDKSKTTGTLYLAPNPGPVPVQIARFGLYLHCLQDSSSHSTYCGDDALAPPGGRDPGTYMYTAGDGHIQLAFGSSCASSPHLAAHVQETGTGDAPAAARLRRAEQHRRRADRVRQRRRAEERRGRGRRIRNSSRRSRRCRETPRTRTRRTSAGSSPGADILRRCEN
jgi:hypothetical protein